MMKLFPESLCNGPQPAWNPDRPRRPVNALPAPATVLAVASLDSPAYGADKDIQHHELLGPQDNSYESRGIEPGAPPIEIDEGLLVVYSSISADFKWTISLLLLDKNDPDKIIAKTDAPVLVPEEVYELKGDVNNVVFPCGALIDKGRLYVYYGAADTVCAVASESMDVIRKALKPFQDRPVPGPRP